MADLIVLFNHTLTPDQEADARAGLKVGRIILPPPEISGLWATVPPDSEGLADYLSPVREWLSLTALPGDYVLVQGEFGATYLMVGHCLARGLVPIYSTTRREARERHLPDGSVDVRHLFSHVRFRRYGR